MIPTDVRHLVHTRSGGHCEVCRAFGTNLHHRLPRGMGGTKLTALNLPPNLLHLCGSGTTGCHGWIEHHRTQAIRLGVLLPSWFRHTPLDQTPVRLAQGWVFLTLSGGYVDATHDEVAGYLRAVQ